MRVQGRKGVPNIEQYICDVAVARHKVGTSSEDELWVLKHRALKVALPLSPTLSHCEAVFDAHLHEIRFLSTGFSSVDELLGGGLVADEVTEIIGPVGAGKSQLMIRLGPAAMAIRRLARLGAGLTTRELWAAGFSRRASIHGPCLYRATLQASGLEWRREICHVAPTLRRSVCAASRAAASTI